VRRQGHVPAAIQAIRERDWQPLEDYPDDGEAQITQTMIGSQRLIVRRTRLLGAQAEPCPRRLLLVSPRRPDAAPRPHVQNRDPLKRR
jgi:hypothetical protein